jgi:tricorn protease
MASILASHSNDVAALTEWRLSVMSAPFLLRDPTLSDSHIAFSYGGNIWIANHDGSELRRLTSAGQEGRPALSPDGRNVAFVGEYGGSRGVFVIPIQGGEPRRVTHHPSDLGLVNNLVARAGDALGWTPDGKRILFSSRRAAFAGGVHAVMQLFTVPLEGGPATTLPLVRAADGSFSADAARLAYVPHVPWQPEWKGYRGGQTTMIRIANLSDSSVEATIPRDNSNDYNPMWVGDTIYFLSDRNGSTTLFSYEMGSNRVRQIVENRGFDIKSAAATPKSIVYEQFGSLHVLDVTSGVDRTLNISPVADFPEIRPHCKSLAGIVGSDCAHPNIAPKLSPTGDHAIFGVRGELLIVPVEGGDIRNLTRTPGVVERDPAWSPDGNSIAYFSDESGEYALHIREQGDLGTVLKIDLGHPPSFYYAPTWSPDSRIHG